ncbi:MAG TPA: NAD(P)H nitroreductase [Pseudonocardia sp.]|nr:NAD(P)H nitroreductase [Pseudonocardia sp.]
MERSVTDEETLQAALGLAVRAPSLHNSQPWHWRVGGRTVQLHLDTARRLPATDPHDRELVISCGAALHHLLVALGSLGRRFHVRRLPDPAEPTHLATVDIVPDVATSVDEALAAAIPRRRTDRRRFSSWPVPPEFLGEMLQLAGLQGVALQAIDDPRLRWKLFRAIAEAAERQDSDAAQAAELLAWSGRPSNAADGVPAANAPPLQRIPGQVPMRPYAHPELAQPETGGEPEAAALLLLSTPSDTRLQWLRAGETTSAVLLAATRDGLASSSLTQPFEVADTRAFLRTAVAGPEAGHPQILLRIGWAASGAAQLPATPRRPLAETVSPL